MIPVSTTGRNEQPSSSYHATSSITNRGLRTWATAGASRGRSNNKKNEPKPDVPSLKTALAMPLSPRQMDNSMLVTLGELGNHQARSEILKRHIMCRDRVSYEQACQTFLTIEQKNHEHIYLLSLPYILGIAMGVTSAAAAWPMVFDLATAEWFNHHFVTTDVPEPKDLETFWEVGAWSWSWNEPVLGTVSFVLLALQFTRAQIQNLGIKPYTAWVKHWRGERLARAFPKYDAEVVIDYSRTATFRK